MKTLARNKKTLYYALQTGINGVQDEYGLFSGQYDIAYAAPVETRMNISPARGDAILEQFGIQEQYDKVLITDDMDCPISEDSVLWLNTVPVIENGVTTTPHDYYVVRVAKSLNNIAIAVKSV